MAHKTNAAKVVVVLGAARSGTMALAAAIAAAEGVELDDAGAGFGLVATLAATEQRYRQSLEDVAQIVVAPKEPEPGSVGLLLDSLVGDRTGPAVLRAADVLPEAPCLKAVRLLAPRLPNAVFVNLTRDGVDFIASRRRVLPDTDFLTHCLVWSQTREAWGMLAPTLGNRAVSLTREALVTDASAVCETLGSRLGWSEEAKSRFLTVIRTSAAGKTSMSQKPIDFVSVGWSLAEKMLFAEVCGIEMSVLGHPLDTAGAIRRRPLRLDEIIGGGEAIFRGASGQLNARDGAEGVSIVWTEDVADGLLVMPAMAINGRNRLTLTAGTLNPRTAPTSLRIDIVESINRRSCASVEALIDSDRVDIAAAIDSTAELVDIMFSTRSAVAGKTFGFRLFEATLSG